MNVSPALHSHTLTVPVPWPPAAMTVVWLHVASFVPVTKPAISSITLGVWSLSPPEVGSGFATVTSSVTRQSRLLGVGLLFVPVKNDSGSACPVGHALGAAGSHTGVRVTSLPLTALVKS